MRLRRAEEIETLSYRIVVELNAESRLPPERWVATIVRRPEYAQRLADDRTSRAQRRQLDREQRGRRQGDRTDRPCRPYQPQERGWSAVPDNPLTPSTLTSSAVSSGSAPA